MRTVPNFTVSGQFTRKEGVLAGPGKLAEWTNVSMLAQKHQERIVYRYHVDAPLEAVDKLGMDWYGLHSDVRSLPKNNDRAKKSLWVPRPERVL